MARVSFTDESREDLRDLDGSARKIVLKALRKLETDPEQRGEPLGGELTTYRKLIVGNRTYRIIYRVEGEEIVVVWVIAKRADSECYEMALARLAMHSNRDLAGKLATVVDKVWSATETQP